MKKTMSKPENWQDFESLCKKLWGEIWKCRSIKKNGRSGQVQNGVDIYGIPTGSENYWGIQCKGKDEYSHAQLTIEEIDSEIEKAKTFTPSLECFLFTTTANKDANIEQHIRCKNLELKKQGFFSLDIYSWEDIVDLIEENKTVYDWYLQGNLHKYNHNISLIINGNDKEIILKPSFIKYKIKTIIEQINNKFYFEPERYYYSREHDLSYVQLDINLINSGDTALEYYKLFINFDDERAFFKAKNYRVLGGVLEIPKPNNYNYEDRNLSHFCDETHPILVPHDAINMTIFLKLPPENFSFPIKYKFISKYYNCTGEIECTIQPEIEEKEVINKIEKGEEYYSENIISKKEIKNMRG